MSVTWNSATSRPPWLPIMVERATSHSGSEPQAFLVQFPGKPGSQANGRVGEEREEKK